MGDGQVLAARRAAVERAVSYVKDGMTLGLGTGGTAELMYDLLKPKIAAGWTLRGVPSSEQTAEKAQAIGITLLTFDEAPHLDLTIDGADEVNPDLALLKGRGGALLREKVVARSSARVLIVVDRQKLVSQLGRGPLPVEVVPFVARYAVREIERAGAVSVVQRMSEGRPFVTDNGNYIFDCAFNPIADVPALDRSLKQIAGVADHGLFPWEASAVIIGASDGSTEERWRGGGVL